LLLAGPGTGKTHQLALRIKFLVEKRRIPADAIAVITFTRESAQNMRRRISDEQKGDVFIRSELRPQRIMTMHGLGLEIIRAHAEMLRLPEDFNVMTDSRLQSHLFRDAGLLSGLGEIKALEAARYRQRSKRVERGTDAARIISSYETILRACKVIDYDDQIRLACYLFSQRPEIREKYKALQHILVDEYQDINADQRRLIEHLAVHSRSGVFAVGDDDQSICDFRGSNPKYIREFKKEFGGDAKILCLDESRRCPETIIRAALRVLETFDHVRIAKPDPKFSEKKKGGYKVLVHSVPSDDDEADIIARLTAKALPKNRVLILVPAKQYAEKIKHALRRRKISYTHPPNLEETGLLLLREVYEWARVPEHSLALRRCIEAVCQSGTINIPSARVRKQEQKDRRAECLKQIAVLWEAVIKDGVPLWDVLKAAAGTGNAFLAEVYNKLNLVRESVGSDIGSFLKAVGDSVQPWQTTEDLVEEVDAWISELRGHAQQSEGEVRIMTLQAAKGLETEVVFVVGLNDGIFPRADCDEDQIAESARLFYVSMTRAITELHLFHARKRDGSITYLQESFALKPSRFLNAIDKPHKEEKYYPARQ
jgi:DNA helicase II / ATP-dependent DNA helicase PcrA